VRRLCREAYLSAPQFYKAFGSLEKFLERAGIKPDKETLKRIKGTTKATKRRTKKSMKKAAQEESKSPNPESNPSERSTAPTLEEIQSLKEDEDEAHRLRLEKIAKYVEDIELLALDPEPQVSGPALDALADVIPHVLKCKYGVSASLEDLIQADHTLLQAREERKELQAKEAQANENLKKNEVERQEIQRERERLKADPEKGELLARIDSLEAEKKLMKAQFDEMYAANKNSRILLISLLGSIQGCNACRAQFHRNIASYKEAQQWLANGKLSLLSFETIEPPRRNSPES
jgi:hypothetical protein